MFNSKDKTGGKENVMPQHDYHIYNIQILLEIIQTFLYLYENNYAKIYEEYLISQKLKQKIFGL